MCVCVFVLLFTRALTSNWRMRERSNVNPLFRGSRELRVFLYYASEAIPEITPVLVSGNGSAMQFARWLSNCSKYEHKAVPQRVFLISFPQLGKWMLEGNLTVVLVLGLLFIVITTS